MANATFREKMVKRVTERMCGKLRAPTLGVIHSTKIFKKQTRLSFECSMASYHCWYEDAPHVASAGTQRGHLGG